MEASVAIGFLGEATEKRKINDVSHFIEAENAGRLHHSCGDF
jgi:hypothetical protein